MTNMKRLRLISGLKQSDVAKMLKTDHAFIARLETGTYKYNLKDSTRMKIEHLFGKSIKYLLKESKVVATKLNEAPTGTINSGIPKGLSKPITTDSTKALKVSLCRYNKSSTSDGDGSLSDMYIQRSTNDIDEG